MLSTFITFLSFIGIELRDSYHRAQKRCAGNRVRTRVSHTALGPLLAITALSGVLPSHYNLEPLSI